MSINFEIPQSSSNTEPDEYIIPDYNAYWREYATKEEGSTFQQYLHNLGIDSETMRDKIILDVGADTRLFAGSLLKKGISSQVFSLEPNQEPEHRIAELYRQVWTPEQKAHIDSHTVQARMEQMPFKDKTFDFVLFHSVTPGFLDGDRPEEMKQNIDDTFSEISRLLRPGGEARIYPYFNDNFKHKWRAIVDTNIQKLISTNKFEVSIEDVTTIKNGQLDQRLIIKRLADEEQV